MFSICTKHISPSHLLIAFMLSVPFSLYFWNFVQDFVFVLCFVNTSLAAGNEVNEMKLTDWSNI